MEKPEFLNSNIETKSVDELKDEKSYFDRIEELAESGKLIKKIKDFPSAAEAQEYLKNRPQKKDLLQRFLPKTNYTIGSSPDSKCAVYSVADKIEGRRLDKIDLRNQQQEFYSQLDDFLFESLKMYGKEGVSPGLNLKNFVLTDQGQIYYVDSQPYPEVGVEPFEIAHAREQRLTRMFGANFGKLLPKTWQWVVANKVEDYKKAKSEAERKRRRS